MYVQIYERQKGERNVYAGAGGVLSQWKFDT